MPNPTIVKVADPAALADSAAQRFIEIGNKAIAKKGGFTVALSGGSTPKAMHNLLATKYKDQIAWNKVEIFFGDERCVPPEHADSNYKMARETLLSKVPIPEQNVYRMRGEIQPEDAAKEYGL